VECGTISLPLGVFPVGFEWRPGCVFGEDVFGTNPFLYRRESAVIVVEGDSTVVVDDTPTEGGFADGLPVLEVQLCAGVKRFGSQRPSSLVGLSRREE